jgi:hypothetical protein
LYDVSPRSSVGVLFDIGVGYRRRAPAEARAPIEMAHHTEPMA